MGSFKQGKTYFFSVSSLNIKVVLRQLCLVHQIREGTIKYKGALELTLLALKMFANTCWRRNICSLEVCARAWSFEMNCFMFAGLRVLDCKNSS